MSEVELMSTPQCGVRYNTLELLLLCEPLNLEYHCCASIVLASSLSRPGPSPLATPLFCMQLLKHVANAMQRAEGFVLERALV